MSLISICVPTCNRLNLLKLSIGSCLKQAYRPLEIVIGDDSPGFESRDWVASIVLPAGITLRYEHNVPRLGQAANVNRLFERAQGARLIILHDDDVLFPDAIGFLADTWDRHPGARCVYGVQHLIRENGAPMVRETDVWNQRYFRIPALDGPQHSALVAALWQQVPNDCYLFETALAQKVGYRSERDVGQCVDAEFVIRAAQYCAPGSFVFIDRPISQYRLTAQSIARARDLNRRQDLLYEMVQKVTGGPAVRNAQHILLSRISVGSALDAAMTGRRALALSILLSRHYSKKYLSLTTFYRLACILSPRVGVTIKAWIRGEQSPNESHLPATSALVRSRSEFSAW